MDHVTTFEVNVSPPWTFDTLFCGHILAWWPSFCVTLQGQQVFCSWLTFPINLNSFWKEHGKKIVCLPLFLHVWCPVWPQSNCLWRTQFYSLIYYYRNMKRCVFERILTVCVIPSLEESALCWGVLKRSTNTETPPACSRPLPYMLRIPLCVGGVVILFGREGAEDWQVCWPVRVPLSRAPASAWRVM